MGSKAPDISIITVNYNGGAVLQRFAESILSHIEADVEIIIYDNASADGSMQLLPRSERIVGINGPENLGFAKGNNKAAALAKGTWLHFLNPDIQVNAQLAHDYAEIINSGEAGTIYVTSLVDKAGEAQQMSMLIPTLGNYFRRAFNPANAKYWCIGASLIMHRDTFAAIGGWSEDYFMYSEDLDLFYTAQKAGIAVKHIDSRIMHIGKVSSSTAWTAQKRADVIEKSFCTFFRKHRSMPEYVLVRLMQFAYQIALNKGEFKTGFRAFTKLLFS